MTSGRASWVKVALGAGLFYLVIGLMFGELAGRATSAEMRVGWRLAAWVISAAAFAAEVAYERLRLASSALSASWHTAFGAGVGAFALAVVAAVHVGAGFDARYALALVAWPAITMIPAFPVALVLSAIFRARRL